MALTPVAAGKKSELHALVEFWGRCRKDADTWLGIDLRQPPLPRACAGHALLSMPKRGQPRPPNVRWLERGCKEEPGRERQRSFSDVVYAASPFVPHSGPVEGLTRIGAAPEKQDETIGPALSARPGAPRSVTAAARVVGKNLQVVMNEQRMNPAFPFISPDSRIAIAQYFRAVARRGVAVPEVPKHAIGVAAQSFGVHLALDHPPGRYKAEPPSARKIRQRPAGQGKSYQFSRRVPRPAVEGCGARALARKLVRFSFPVLSHSIFSVPGARTARHVPPSHDLYLPAILRHPPHGRPGGTCRSWVDLSLKNRNDRPDL